MEQRQQTEMRLMVLLGIIKQLTTTRQSKLFSALDLTLPQFSLMVHFTHAPERSWTVTELAEVMEMNQPGITKIVNVLLEKGLLTSEPDKIDRRKRHLKITDHGLNSCKNTMTSLVPDISHIFGDWQDEELLEMQLHLEKLMSWLDNHRDDIKQA